eukprot:490523_1
MKQSIVFLIKLFLIIIMLMIQILNTTKRTRFGQQSPIPIFTVNKLQISYHTTTGFYIKTSIPVHEHYHIMPPVFVGYDVDTFRMNWEVQITSVYSVTPNIIRLHHHYEFMDINGSEIFITNDKFVSETQRQNHIKYSFPVLINIQALKYRRFIILKQTLQITGIDGTITNYTLELENSFSLQASLIKQVNYGFNGTNVIVNPFKDSCKTVPIPIKAEFKSIWSTYTQRSGYMEQIGIAQEFFKCVFLINPEIFPESISHTFRVTTSYDIIHLGGSIIKTIRINPTHLNCKFIPSTRRMTCVLKLKQITMRHTKHNPIIGIMIKFHIYFAPGLKQQIKFYFLTEGITFSTNDWSTKICAVDALFRAYIRYAFEWNDIEARDKRIKNSVQDMLWVDRHFAFNQSNIIYYLQHMKTKTGNTWNIFDLYQYPFDFAVIHYINENGIDEGALTQDLFINIFISLSQFIGTNDENGGILQSESKLLVQKGILGLMRSWNLCWRMRDLWKIKSEKETRELQNLQSGAATVIEVMDVDIDCRLHTNIINPLYFEIAFGKMDQLIESTDDKEFIIYIRKLMRNNLVQSWIIEFCKKYFTDDDSNMYTDEIVNELITGVYGGAGNIPKKPNTLKSKMLLIRDYLYNIEFKGIIDIIRNELYFFGIVFNKDSLWLNYKQFYDMFFVETTMSKEDIDKLNIMIKDDYNWQSDTDVVKNSQIKLQKCLTTEIIYHYEKKDVEWIHNFLQFWTG